MLVDTISTNIFSTVYAWYSHSIEHPIFQYNQSFLWLKIFQHIILSCMLEYFFDMAEAPGYDPDSVLSKNTGLPLAYASVYRILAPTTSRSSRRYGRWKYLIFRRSNICPIHDTMKITVTVMLKYVTAEIWTQGGVTLGSFQDCFLKPLGHGDKKRSLFDLNKWHVD